MPVRLHGREEERDAVLLPDYRRRSRVGRAYQGQDRGQPAAVEQRALRGEPRHGFMLVVCDPKVCKANPDQMLYQFALHLQRLAGWRTQPESRGNDIVYEWLYLRDPKTTEIVKFTFSVDFFAAAGDAGGTTTVSPAGSPSRPTASGTWSGIRSGMGASRTRRSGPCDRDVDHQHGQ